MPPIEECARRVLQMLRELGYESALVGGLAVGVRAKPRTTLDADLAVAVESDAQAEAIAYELQRHAYTLVDVIEQTARERLATARFRIAEESRPTAYIDLLFASSGIEPEIVAAANEIEILPGFRFPVAQRGHLLALKALAHDEERRPQDRIDIMALLERADERDLALARGAAALITSRGFHRDKDLIAELELFVRLARRLGGGR